MAFLLVVQRHDSLLAGIGFSSRVSAIPKTHEPQNDGPEIEANRQASRAGAKHPAAGTYSLADYPFDLKTKLNEKSAGDAREL
jgi:hypothetical protein